MAVGFRYTLQFKLLNAIVVYKVKKGLVKM